MCNNPFETKVCSRCGGTGRHSYNTMHLDMCYGCGGTGYQYTPRGKLALQFYNNSLTVPASELQVGMVIKDVNSQKTSFVPITMIDFGTDKELGLKYKTSYFEGQSGDKPMVYVKTNNGQTKFYLEDRVRLMQSKEEKSAKLKAAIEYQKTLKVK